MSWEDILKAPPIRNPRETEFSQRENENLSMREYVDLFERVVDPMIEENKNEYAVAIPVTELKMSEKKAEKIAQKLYKNMGYNMIFAKDGTLYFKLQGEGRV
jgi:hypothetical protein|tara:strand:- start:15375 stop:15680 length:306 start_codon:yes stop_codon:yes gene_type:complete